MLDTRFFIRAMRVARKSLGIGSTQAADRCVKAVRHYLSQSYPNPDSRIILRIIAKSGVDRIPLQLLIAGHLSDRSSAGAAQALERALRGADQGYGDPHPLFSSSFYAWSYADVASADVAPWVHYQVFGVREARAPHPLLDPLYMSQWLVDESPLTVVDAYLRTPRYWTIDTSPYLDAQRFALESEFKSDVPPLMRMLAANEPETWLSFKLMLIDAALPEAKIARLNAATFLIARHASKAWQRQLVTWSHEPDRARASGGGGLFTVVPGYFLGSEGKTIVAVDSKATSPDLTMVRLATEYVSLSDRSSTSVDRLIFVRSHLDRRAVENLLRGEGTVAIAAHSPGQAVAMSALVHRVGRDDVSVLPYGQQINIESKSMVIADLEPVATESWDWSLTADAGEVLFLLPQARRAGAKTVASIAGWLARGSSLLTLDEAALTEWTALLDRPYVVAHPDLVDQVRVLVEGGSLRVLADEIASS